VGVLVGGKINFKNLEINMRIIWRFYIRAERLAVAPTPLKEQMARPTRVFPLQASKGKLLASHPKMLLCPQIIHTILYIWVVHCLQLDTFILL